MANTTNFGWETPDDTDLVKDGAAAIRTLGSAIDTSLADLEGGTTGQILAKNSNTDMDFIWVTNDVGDITEVQAGTGISVASGTGPIPVITNTVATEFDAKGDLIVGTGADTFDKLTVGANDTILVADSSTSTGLKWAAPATSSSGLTLIGTTSFTTSAAVNINSVFSGTYDNYKVIVELVGSAGMDIAWRFRTSGTDNTNSNYNYDNLFAFSTTVASGGQSGQSSFPKFLEYSIDKSFASADVLKPFASEITSITSNGNLNYAAGFHGWVMNGQFSTTTSFDGFSLIPSTGTITGKATVYGYAK